MTTPLRSTASLIEELVRSTGASDPAAAIRMRAQELIRKRYQPLLGVRRLRHRPEQSGGDSWGRLAKIIDKMVKWDAVRLDLRDGVRLVVRGGA